MDVNTTQSTGLLRLWADFNMERDGRIYTSLNRPVQPEPVVLAEGQRVLLVDADGDTCEATVLIIKPPIVHLRVDYAIWQDGPAEPHGKGETE